MYKKLFKDKCLNSLLMQPKILNRYPEEFHEISHCYPPLPNEISTNLYKDLHKREKEKIN